ncbi:Flagellar biosynthesis protein FlhA [Dehalobacter sp. UNSWDHB]|jgi:flagellar biosynthesis protein FlhA|uniref:flagellar biosynthesis protein FlhA n=1 Tax=unclassified Dehalobacter TaxID=2635733 RepID=UPI00028AF452|nr:MULTISPECIES: flagellar biosynthesis protein FlhA [unclassified Dehalobacter]AFV02548.1 Flagellar biosynthesis protein FlhA [Dehalobacter sp. DCA]AFV05537.1 Flagellar biosynthesis protein FlhA [Dehalobacter sp. CF]EQB21793.1 Flagellar biosynthesis protein FlhA [Dehalobacter sp. UNSWDHB]
MATTTRAGRLARNTDIIAAISIVGIIVVMVIGVPAGWLDFLITLNITGSVLILLLAVFTKDPLEFSVLPSLLLTMTLFRLALNLSTTKLILLEAEAGQVIQQFGEFVIQGNPIVGFIVFCILVVVQFLVITKGAERVSEVGARFTLDAMPGKQMSIDADLNAGIITDQEARARRLHIQQEADFYGAMDGASKFVKGDAIAAIIILLINIIGGFIIGMVTKGMAVTDALYTYTLLTIGDGLVTQIPALLISTATGLIVTRAASDSNLGQDLAKQLFRTPKALYITSGVLVALAIFGMPQVPMLMFATATAGMGYYLQRNTAQAAKKESEAAVRSDIDETKKPENVMNMLGIDHMELEIGYALIPLVDAGQGGDLLDRIILIRRQLAGELGFIVPVIRVRDNMNLQPNQYTIKLKGAEVASGELMTDHYLAFSGGIEDDSIQGIPTKEPAFGLDAKWINASVREQAELSGYTVVDAPTVLATHLTEVLKTHAHEIISRQDVKKLIDHAKEQSPAVVEELIPDLLSIGQVQKVLSNLLRERVSVKDLVTILETLADCAPLTKDIDRLTEYVRQNLARQIVQPFLNPQKKLPVITLEPKIEQMILDNLRPSDFGSYVNIDPNVIQKLLKRIGAQVEKIMLQGHNPVMLCAPVVRISLKRMTERQLPHLVILSYNELVQGIEVQALGMVVLD